MKKFLLSFAIPAVLLLIPALAAASGLAEINDAMTSHAPRDGDRLSPGVSPDDAVLIIESDSAAVLAATSLFCHERSSDIAIHIDGDTVAYVQSATKYRFLISSGLLPYLGFENRATDFSTDAPVPVMRLPLTAGEVTESAWSGSAYSHGKSILKRVKGYSRSTVERGWTISAEGDTIHDAVRVKWRTDMAYADADGIDTAQPDSVNMESVSDLRVELAGLMSERLLTEREMWFSDVARYPVLLRSTTSRVMTRPGLAADTVPASGIAMYYPPHYQHGDTGEMPEDMPRKSDGHGNRPVDNGYGTDGFPAELADASVSGNTVSVRLSSRAGTVRVTLALYTDSGIRLTDSVALDIGPVPQTYTIDMPDGYRGVILVRAEAGEESVTCKVIV